ncbi:MAG TPA: lipocalin family protein [Bacteroidales bacterium]
MKKTLRYLTALVVLTLIAVSCTKLGTTYDQTLLTGKWKSGTLYYKYAANGTGGTWDTADNVTEAEAQPFTWTLDNDLLTQIHILQIGGSVPKVYTVTELTATSLKYHDSFNVSFSFTKAVK